MFTALKTNTWDARLRRHRQINPFGVQRPWLFAQTMASINYSSTFLGLLLVAITILLPMPLVIAQDGQPVNSSAGSPYVGYQTLAYVSGSNLIYLCQAKSSVTSTITVSAASNASPVSFTATAHNIGDYANLGATVTPIVLISGGTGNWAAVNGTWTATITTANAFTIPVDSSGFGAVTGTLAVTTMSPRLNVAQWAVQHFTYDGSNNLTSTGWAQNPGGAGGTNLRGSSTGYSFKCSSRTLLAYE